MIRLTILLISVAFSYQDLYTKVINRLDPDALCLDGTSPALFLHQGQQKDKFLLYFTGGGVCIGLTVQKTAQNCYARSKTQFGSSKFWPEKIQGQGILSANSSISQFANWTKIGFGYCDGSFHQGYRKNAISYNGQNLYFRGSAITRSHLKWIMNKFPQFVNSKNIVVAGSSAGGIAAYLWTNYVKSLVKNPQSVVTIIDSAIFLSFQNPILKIDVNQAFLVNLFKVANADEKTPLQSCNERYPLAQYRCFSIQYAWTFINGRILLINSEYDTLAIQNILRINCLTQGKTQKTLAMCNILQLSAIERYRMSVSRFLRKFTSIKENSAWTIGCSNHVYLFNDKQYSSENIKVPALTGLTAKDAVSEFYFKNLKVKVFEQRPWPENIGCAF